MAALSDYVEFPFAGNDASRPGRFETDLARPDAGTASSSMSLRKGMSWDDVRRLLGVPEKTADRMEGRLKVTTATFTSGDHQVDAEFVEGILIKYSIASK